MSPRELRVRTLAPALAAALAIAAGAPLPAQSDVPSHEQRVDPGTIVESPDAMKVTTVIQCFCGTCANQTLHDCTCGVAESERRRVAAALAEGESPESLIAAYMAEHGPQIRIVPEVRGFDLIGFSVPFVAAAAGLFGLFFVLRGWRRRVPSGPEGTDPRDGVDAQYHDRLARDLEALDR